MVQKEANGRVNSQGEWEEKSMPFFVTGMKWDRCKTQPYLCLAVFTSNHLDVLLVQSRFSSLEYLEHPEVSSNAWKEFSRHQYHNTVIVPFLYPWSCARFLGGTFGKLSSTGNLVDGKYGGKGEGCSQSFPSVFHHQIAQNHEIWCENNLSACLCLEKAARNMQKEYPIGVGVTMNYHSLVRTACFGPGLRRISCLRDRN